MKVLVLCLVIGIAAACASPEETAESEPVSLLPPSPEWVTFGDENRGYLVRPEGEDPSPAVVMVHEWWGLNQNIRDMAELLAKQGYVVLAVDLFDGTVTASPEEADQLSTQAREEMDTAIGRMKSAVAFLRGHEAVRADAIASMGWCFGGQMALQLALNEPLQATVIYYGNLVTEEELLSTMESSVLGIFAEEDTVVPVESVREFEAALNRVGVSNQIHIYPGVGHAFANPSNPDHDVEKTEDAWAKTVDFLASNLE